MTKKIEKASPMKTISESVEKKDQMKSTDDDDPRRSKATSTKPPSSSEVLAKLSVSSISGIVMSPKITENIVSYRDKYKFVYFVFYFAGLTILFPFSMLISISDFWYYKFRNTSLPLNETSQTLNHYQKSFPAYLSMSGNAPLMVFVVLTSIVGYKIRIKTRIISCSIGMVICFGGLTLLSGVNTDDWQDILFVTVLLANCLYTTCNAVFQATFTGNLGRFPRRYIGSTNDGMGLGATLPVIINIIILAFNTHPENVGVACMVSSQVIIVLMIILYIPASSTPFYIHHSGCNDKTKISAGFSDYWAVLKKIWVYPLVIFLTYMMNLAVHPAVSALVKPVSKEPSVWNDTFFLPVCCFLVRAVGDWSGKSLATFTQWPGPGRKTEIAVLLSLIPRVVMIPLLMRCHIAPLNRTTEILFRSDYAYIIILSLFSFSAGYIGNVGMMLGPKKVSVSQMELAGRIQEHHEP